MTGPGAQGPTRTATVMIGTAPIMAARAEADIVTAACARS